MAMAVPSLMLWVCSEATASVRKGSCLASNENAPDDYSDIDSGLESEDDYSDIGF